MGANKSKLIAGICFLIGSLLCIYSLITKEYQSYYLTGLILFAIVGVGFIRASRKP